MASLSHFYPNAGVGLVGLLDLPQDTVERFEGLSERFIQPSAYRRGNFEKILRVQNTDTSISYVAFQTKQYPTNQFDEPGAIERLMLLWEKIGDMVCGSGEVRYNITDRREFFLNKPFVGYTESDPLISNPKEKKLVRQGFGIRRLRLMHALTMSEYGLPLYSDTGGGVDPEPLVWEKLVRIGEARKLDLPDGRRRYVMTL
jgi:hypothetical protein